MTVKRHLFASACSSALILGASLAHADPADIIFWVCQELNCGDRNNTSYIGPGLDSAIENTSSVPGGVREASNSYASDAYDGYGAIYGAASLDGPEVLDIVAYDTAFNGLTATRQTETYVAVTTLPGGTIRWFDSFTNTTESTIDATIAFGGNLGSDSSTWILEQGATYVVHGQNQPGNSSGDPVIVSIWGNNDYAALVVPTIQNEEDSFYIPFPISVAPGQTVSIMNVDMLVASSGRQSDSDGAIYASDAILASQLANLFINSPIFDGLTAGQVTSLINWGVDVGTGLDNADGIFALGTLAQRGFAYALSNSNKMRTPGNVGNITASTKSKSTSGTLAKPEVGTVFLFGDYLNGHNDNANGTVDYNGNVAGVGYERDLADGLTAGVALGFTNTNGSVSATYPSINNEQLVIMLYMNGDLANGFKYEGSVFGLSQKWDYQRVAGAGTATGAISGATQGASVKLSKEIAWSGTTITPFVGLSSSRTSVNGYTETGAGSANLTVPSFSFNSLEASIGADLIHKFAINGGADLTLFASAALRSELSDDTSITTAFSSGSTTFNNVVGGGTGTYGTLDLGLSFAASDNAVFSISYGGVYGKEIRQNSVGLDVSIAF